MPRRDLPCRLADALEAALDRRRKLEAVAEAVRLNCFGDHEPGDRLRAALAALDGQVTP